MVVETVVRSKIPRTLRRKLGCDDEVASAVTASVHRGLACEIVSTSSAEALQIITYEPNSTVR